MVHYLLSIMGNLKLRDGLVGAGVGVVLIALFYLGEQLFGFPLRIYIPNRYGMKQMSVQTVQPAIMRSLNPLPELDDRCWLIIIKEEMKSMLNDDYSEEPRQTGYVKWFDDQKKYGFISRENDSDVFVHFSNINRDPQTLNEYERVEFTVVPGEKGPEAHDVIVLVEET